MKKMWYSSPDFADALSLTFFVDTDNTRKKQKVATRNVWDYY